jgi:PAS domain S-box-containing protein
MHMTSSSPQAANGRPELASASWRAYFLALALTLLGWGARELLTPLIGPTALPFISFFPAVAAATWLGGVGPGAGSVALAIAIVFWRFLPFDGTATMAIADAVSVIAFAVAAALIVGPISGLRRARGRLRQQLEEAREIERELAVGREAAARLAAVVEYSGDAIFTKNLEGVVETWNASAERLFGYTADEIVGRPVLLLIPPDRGDEEAQILARLRSGQPVERMETLRVAKGGRHIRVLISVSPLRDRDGHIVGASTVVHDITDIVEAREALGRERQLLKTTLTSIGDGVIVTDVEGRVTFLNPEAVRLTGWTEGDAAGRELRDVFHIINEHTRAVVENPVDKVRRLGTVVGMANHTILIAKDGTETPIDDSAAPIRKDAHDYGVVLVFRDVTDRKKAEDALRRADNRKDEFLAILSHELRNPLNPILLAATMLKHAGASQPDVMQLRDVIDRQARQMGRLLDDLLDISRINSGKISLRTERVDLASAISIAVEASRAQIDSLGHTLTVTTPSDLIEVDGDAGRIAQVMGNLLNNAAKFTKRGGRIDVTLERQGDEAVVRVRDSGIGIVADQLPRIFEMFAQGDRALEGSDSGLGIGLSLARTLVELHRGTLEGSSGGRDQGSEFVIRLPIAYSPKPAETVVSDAVAPNGRRFRILVADDNLDSATTLGALLRRGGHQVQSVPDGFAVLESVPVFRPDVVILDIGMPGMNGYDVARRIRADYGASLLILAITGWGQERDKRLAREAGINHHLTKPVTIEAVERLLGQHSPISSQ